MPQTQAEKHALQRPQKALQQMLQAWADLQQAMNRLEKDGQPYPDRADLEARMRRLLDHLQHP